MRSSTILAIVGTLALAACGQSDPAPGVAGKADSAPQSEIVGSWQAGGTFPGECTDMACPAQFSFRLELYAMGACSWIGQTRAYRSDPKTAEWSYEHWHPFTPTQGPCKWTAPDDWHVKITLRQSGAAWSGRLNGSILEVTSPELQNQRVHFSRVNP